VTGFIVNDVAAAVAALGELDRLDRHLIRARFERRFTAERMANDYVAAYSSLRSVLELPLSAGHLALGSGHARRVGGDQDQGTMSAA
jgi:hypothetical protein